MVKGTILRITKCRYIISKSFNISIPKPFYSASCITDNWILHGNSLNNNVIINISINWPWYCNRSIIYSSP